MPLIMIIGIVLVCPTMGYVYLTLWVGIRWAGLQKRITLAWRGVLHKLHGAPSVHVWRFAAARCLLTCSIERLLDLKQAYNTSAVMQPLPGWTLNSTHATEQQRPPSCRSVRWHLVIVSAAPPQFIAHLQSCHSDVRQSQSLGWYTGSTVICCCAPQIQFICEQKHFVYELVYSIPWFLGTESLNITAAAIAAQKYQNSDTQPSINMTPLPPPAFAGIITDLCRGNCIFQ